MFCFVLFYHDISNHFALTMQHQMPHSHVCCSAIVHKQRCRRICPLHLSEWWNGLAGSLQIQTEWSSVPSYLLYRCEQLESLRRIYIFAKKQQEHSFPLILFHTTIVQDLIFTHYSNVVRPHRSAKPQDSGWKHVRARLHSVKDMLIIFYGI